MCLDYNLVGTCEAPAQQGLFFLYSSREIDQHWRIHVILGILSCYHLLVSKLYTRDNIHMGIGKDNELLYSNISSQFGPTSFYIIDSFPEISQTYL